MEMEPMSATALAYVPSFTAQTDTNDLIAAHLAGDERAFTRLVTRYQPRLVNFVTRMIQDRERAEDLVQEAFLRVYRHLNRFDQSRKFSTWVYTIASNLARNELRNRKRSPLVLYQTLESNNPDGAPIEFEDSDNRPDELYHQRHLRELVDAAVDRLGETHREVFVMRELEGKSYEEIAEITRTNLGTVKSRLNRARSAFAEEIQPHLG
jgi:RNA polymerase sigma-70 factor (ECF subfamily)